MRKMIPWVFIRPDASRLEVHAFPEDVPTLADELQAIAWGTPDEAEDAYMALTGHRTVSTYVSFTLTEMNMDRPPHRLPLRFA